jgi:hypothetical protein
MDITLAVVIFIVSFFIIYGLITNKVTNNISTLNEEAEIISKEATSQDSRLSLTNGDSLNETKVKDLVVQNYSEIKKRLRIKNDFCIYFEDAEGNILRIQNVSGIGSSEINISGIECGIVLN